MPHKPGGSELESHDSKRSRSSPVNTVIADRPPLLKLPLEIREQILGYLLTSPGPVFFQSKLPHRTDCEHDSQIDRPLWVNVLSTCKQLRDEGRKILYANTIGIQVGTEGACRDDPVETVVLGRRYAQSSTYTTSPETPLDLPTEVERFSRVHIDIYSNYYIAEDPGTDDSEDEMPPLDHDDRKLLYRAVCALTQVLARHSSWIDLTIELHGPDGLANTREDKPQLLWQSVLRPLTRLRGRRSVKLNNIRNPVALKLRELPLLSGPTILAEEMYNQLHSYYMSIIKPKVYWTGTRRRLEEKMLNLIRTRFLEGVTETLEEQDPHCFLEQRRIMLHTCSLLVVWRNAAIFDADHEAPDRSCFQVEGVTPVVGGGFVNLDEEKIERAVDELANIPYEPSSLDELS